MAKGITYFAHGMMAGVVVGAEAPLVVGSRAGILPRGDWHALVQASSSPSLNRRPLAD